MKVRDAAKLFEEYDRRTNKKMAEHNRAGGEVRKPVRSLKNASEEDKKDRANFLYRKASQALTANHPLKDEKGRPTPAAMQFKRWQKKSPKTKQTSAQSKQKRQG
jgi:hypothetical protein